jgi:Tol biopolymer transport system component
MDFAGNKNKQCSLWLTDLGGKNALKNVQLLGNFPGNNTKRCAFMARFD